MNYGLLCAEVFEKEDYYCLETNLIYSMMTFKVYQRFCCG